MRVYTVVEKDLEDNVTMVHTFSSLESASNHATKLVQAWDADRVMHYATRGGGYWTDSWGKLFEIEIFTTEVMD